MHAFLPPARRAQCCPRSAACRGLVPIVARGAQPLEGAAGFRGDLAHPVAEHIALEVAVGRGDEQRAGSSGQGTDRHLGCGGQPGINHRGQSSN